MFDHIPLVHCAASHRPQKATPEQRVRMGWHILQLAERSNDLGLVAAAGRLLDDVNTYDGGSAFLELFADVDDACDGLGLHVGSRRTFEGYRGP